MRKTSYKASHVGHGNLVRHVVRQRWILTPIKVAGGSVPAKAALVNRR